MWILVPVFTKQNTEKLHVMCDILGYIYQGRLSPALWAQRPPNPLPSPSFAPPLPPALY